MNTNVKIVTLAALTIITIGGCKKNTAPSFPLNYTTKMGGIRFWSGVTIHNFVDSSGGLHNDSTNINDTFSIKIINDKTILAPNILNFPNLNNAFSYFQYDSTNSITFSTSGTSFNESPFYSLTYNYQNNTINYYGFNEDSSGYYFLILTSVR